MNLYRNSSGVFIKILLEIFQIFLFEIPPGITLITSEIIPVHSLEIHPESALNITQRNCPEIYPG